MASKYVERRTTQTGKYMSWWKKTKRRKLAVLCIAAFIPGTLGAIAVSQTTLDGAGQFMPIDGAITLVPVSELRNGEQWVLPATGNNYSIATIECEATAEAGGQVERIDWESETMGEVAAFGEVSFVWRFTSYNEAGERTNQTDLPKVSRTTPGPLGGMFSPAPGTFRVHCRATLDISANEVTPGDIGVATFAVRAY